MTIEMFSPLILMDFSMTHSHMTNRCSFISSNSGAWLNSFVILFPRITYYSYDESQVLSYYHPFLLLWLLFLCCIILFHGCAIVLCVMTHFWLISDSFLTHIILHAGRIFWQRHHNCIICLVIEPALHVYKGQFSPWFGQFRHYWNSHIMGILI